MIKKSIKWFGRLIFIVLLILGISSVYSIYQAKKHPGELPSILGYKVMTVLSGSMSPRVEAGDVVIVKPSDPMQAKVNDVITYKLDSNTLVTHRIVKVMNKDGKVFFQTKGDANNVADEKLVATDQVVGSLFFHIPKAGYVANFLRSSTGLMILFAIPLLPITIGALKNIFSIRKREENTDLKA
ncbi:signal peptidase I [Bacillus sp. FJAT-49736]|uniref:signal peptidase I n=1 Tax=Bacillus sp. FJAT-49736 TaxID=2833582 RepID=UPI001BCA49D0|nr:signal peptidase I [Bacillus sp. FJAT-49736]